MASPVNLAITRAERAAQRLRPAVIVFGGAEIACTPGNLDFFERLRNDGGGFTKHQGMTVRILRADIPEGLDVFKRGRDVIVRDDSTDPGEEFLLIVGDNNSRQSTLLILNLERLVV